MGMGDEDGILGLDKHDTAHRLFTVNHVEKVQKLTSRNVEKLWQPCWLTVCASYDGAPPTLVGFTGTRGRLGSWWHHWTNLPRWFSA